MVPALVWLPEDALALRCSVEEVGTLRPDVDVLERLQTGREDQQLARRYAPLAVAHLARLAAGEGRSAVSACLAILDRAYGPSAAFEPPPERPASPAMPPWLTEQRLRDAYQGMEWGTDNPHTDD
jgi:hypothetical protein